MLDYAPVKVSGRGTNAEFIIDDSMPFAETSEALRGYLIEHRGLWSGGEIILTVGTRFFSGEQLNEFKEIIENESGLQVVRFSCVPDTIAKSPGDHAAQSPNFPQHNAVLTSIPDNAHVSGNTNIQIGHGGSRTARWPCSIRHQNAIGKAVSPPSKAQAKADGEGHTGKDQANQPFERES